MPKRGQRRNPGPSGNELGRAVNEAERLRKLAHPEGHPQRPDFARSRRKGSGGDDLATAVAREELWPTPNAADGKGGRISPDEAILSGRRPSGAKAQRTLREAVRKDDLATGSPPPRAGALHPTWVEWLMGFPLGWTALPASATPSSRRPRSGSAGGSSSTRSRREQGEPDA
jgi:hypothetical protein